MSLYDAWRAEGPDDAGPAETAWHPVKDSTPAECVWCRKLFDVAGYSEAAERGQFECVRCAYVIGEVAMGRMCPTCEAPKEHGQACEVCP